jgi:predicted secreted Zn-dependent protease
MTSSWFRTPLFLSSVAAIIFASTQFAYVESAITEHRLFYDVTGQSLRDVNGQMFSGTPIIVEGKKRIAACYPDIRWQYKYESDSDWCMIKSVSVTVRILYRMPRWAGYSSASPEMKEKWDAFYARLDEHEQGHGKLAIEAARDIEREIGKLKRRSCQELKEAVNETGLGFLKQLDVSYKEYDARTKHGVLQDAVLHEY